MKRSKGTVYYENKTLVCSRMCTIEQHSGIQHNLRWCQRVTLAKYTWKSYAITFQ